VNCDRDLELAISQGNMGLCGMYDWLLMVSFVSAIRLPAWSSIPMLQSLRDCSWPCPHLCPCGCGMPSSCHEAVLLLHLYAPTSVWPLYTLYHHKAAAGTTVLYFSDTHAGARTPIFHPGTISGALCCLVLEKPRLRTATGALQQPSPQLCCPDHTSCWQHPSWVALKFVLRYCPLSTGMQL